MKKSIVIIAIVAGIVALAAAGYYFGYDRGWEKSLDNAINEVDNNPNQENENASQPFKKDQNNNFYGTLTLTGYIQVQTRVCNPGDMCGRTVEYAHFVFTDTTSEAIKEFTGVNDGNSFIAGDRVGIGCVEKEASVIKYENFADSGEISGRIHGDDYAKLMASTKTKPVQLKMTRELYTSGRGAPDCYSHFRNFDVI